MRIAQVLTNLLTNAYKYSPANAAVWLRLRRSRGEVRVEVTDEGPGIPPEEQPYIFERFYRVPGIKAQQGAGGGLGLGLYLCFHLVQSHGGRIGVDSEVGRGSTFWFTLPLVARAGGGGRARRTYQRN
jgi:signal transduction histidine kinase